MSFQAKELSSWALNISPSPTLAVDAKAKALQAAGEDVCQFGTGEPDFDTPVHIKEACERALREGKTKYIPTPGLPALRDALAQKYQKNWNNPSIKSQNVVVSPGGKYSCYLAILATCSLGDEVIIPAPYWVSYPEMVKLAGATPKYIYTNHKTHFKITPEQLKAAITPKTKLFIYNSPSNPTGSIYEKHEIEALVEICLQSGVRIMSDEIYEDLLYDGVKHISPASLSPDAAEATITVSGFSKTYSMTGWRLGTLVAPSHIATAVTNIQSHTTSNATTFAQYGALEALLNTSATQKALDSMLHAFNQRRLLLFNGLNNIPKISCTQAKAAFYLFPKISEYGMNSIEFSAKLLEEEKVAVVPGLAFGADDYIRFSYATSETTIQKGLERLARFCNQLSQ